MTDEVRMPRGHRHWQNQWHTNGKSKGGDTIAVLRPRTTGRRLGWGSPLLLCLLACLVTVTLPGCRGCESPEARQKREAEEAEAQRKKEQEEKEAKKKKKDEPPKDDFTIGNLLALPNEYSPGGAVKPGHWIGVSQLMQANKADFQGDVVWQSDDSGKPLLIPRAPIPFHLRMSRPLSLAQKQTTPKQIEMTLFVPRGRETTRLSERLVSSSLGMQIPAPGAVYQNMAPHEYHIVVLSNDPRRYNLLNSLDSIRPPTGEEGEKQKRGRYYYVLMPPANKPVPLPSLALTWTSIAYIIWDDMRGELDAGQQQALVDWLHWGGQLIISGPESLDTLRAGFLAPYLPAAGAGAATLSTADLAKLSGEWTYPLPRGSGRAIRAIQPWSAVKLKPRSDVPGVAVLATTTKGEPLVVEGRVGRGRIVVTSFRLAERELNIWHSFDHFLNGCLLRRPARHYDRDGDHVAVRWQNEKLDPADPHPVTGMRLFGRDTGYEFVPVPDEEGSTANLRRIPPPQHLSQAQVTPADENEPPRLGLGAWNDAAPVPAAARSVIREAAGIEIPSASFVVWVLAGYLLVLVPLNWVVFRLIGRIEWAWVAAPLIAIGGTALVVRLAQLDIGFVRSVTDVGVLETQPSHPRGHLTRFSALYTSLSTGYDIEFDDPTGLIQPFSTGDGVPPVGESPHDLEYRRDDKVRLSGFHVLSNRADLVRSEQLIDLGGPIALAPTDGKVDPGVSYTANVENRSKFELLHPIAVRRGAAADTWEVAWLENLRPGLRGAAAFESIPTRELLARWDEKSSITIGVADKILSLRQLLQETLKDKEFRRGDVKLLASIGTALPGLTVKPRSTQPRHLTLLVANLAYATAPIQHDENSRWQVSVKTFTPETSDEPAKGGQP